MSRLRQDGAQRKVPRPRLRAVRATRSTPHTFVSYTRFPRTSGTSAGPPGPEKSPRHLSDPVSRAPTRWAVAQVLPAISRTRQGELLRRPKSSVRTSGLVQVSQGSRHCAWNERGPTSDGTWALCVRAWGLVRRSRGGCACRSETVVSVRRTTLAGRSAHRRTARSWCRPPATTREDVVGQEQSEAGSAGSASFGSHLHGLKFGNVTVAV
jgi:hypothetical protein